MLFCFFQALDRKFILRVTDFKKQKVIPYAGPDEESAVIMEEYIREIQASEIQ
jgi:hypothetical protein